MRKLLSCHFSGAKSLGVLVLGLLPIVVCALRFSGQQDSKGSDPIDNLQSKMELKTASLDFEPAQGYLRSVLKQLKISPDSQVLVFSKSSLQSSFIGPETPRAIYFNDDTYVAWIPGAPLLEIMSIDPLSGVQFYTLKNEELARPNFKYETQECFRCHGGRSATQAPRLIARSSSVAPSGYPRVFTRTFDVNPQLPLKNRWGGWYVTGTHGEQRHMGNELSVGTDQANTIDIEKGSNVTDLSRCFDTKQYLTPNSDIVALMVFEQQMYVQNVLTSTSLRVRSLQATPEVTPDFLVQVQRACEPLVEALLCVGESKLTSPIRGSDSFSKMYDSSAPKDLKQRSLSELDLGVRLLKYSCSPLIYSKSFESLPDAARSAVWHRLKEILTSKDDTKPYSHLSASDRQAILEILRDTKPEFARYLSG